MLAPFMSLGTQVKRITKGRETVTYPWDFGIETRADIFLGFWNRNYTLAWSTQSGPSRDFPVLRLGLVLSSRSELCAYVSSQSQIFLYGLHVRPYDRDRGYKIFSFRMWLRLRLSRVMASVISRFKTKLGLDFAFQVFFFFEVSPLSFSLRRPHSPAQMHDKTAIEAGNSKLLTLFHKRGVNFIKLWF